MLTPEKNDIDISKLFNWGKIFTITDDEGNEALTCYMRLPGDAEINRSRVYALRKSAELRRKLNNPDSDERLAYIGEDDLLDKESLESFIFLVKSRDFYRETMKDLNIPFPKEPKDDAPLEEFEKYQQEIDEFPAKAEEEIVKQVQELTAKELEKLKKLSKEELYKEYVKMTINELCEQEMSTRFKEMCIFFATFKDESCEEKLFSSIEQLQNLNTRVRDQLFSNYNSLEMDMVSLKK